MAATYSKNFMFSLALLRFITEQAIAQNDTFEVDSNQTISGSSPSPVLEDSEPVWVENDTITNITYQENQSGILTLDCRLKYREPLPTITWLKDGFFIDRRDEYSFLIVDDDPHHVRILGTIMLFARAVKGIEGKYICVAENDYGQSNKTFWITIQNRDYVDYWLAFAGFGSFFLVMACCALRVTTLDKPFSQQSKSKFKKVNPFKK